MMGETVPDIAQTTFFDILLDRIKRLLFRNFHLRVGPSGNLDDHVKNAIVLVCKERNVMEGRDNSAIVLDVHSMV